MHDLEKHLISPAVEHGLQHDAVFYIGTVVAVDGRRIRVGVDKLKNTSHLLYKGTIVRNIAVGSYVKITRGFDLLIGVVDGEYLREDHAAETEYVQEGSAIIRELEVSLIGILNAGRFERGIQQLPLLGNECFILTSDEFQAIHAVSDIDSPQITLGALAIEPDQPINIKIDSLLASHVGIFGTTGSGKSYTLAKIYREIFKCAEKMDRFKDASRFLLIDFNGEFISARSESTNSVKLEPIFSDVNLRTELVLSTMGDQGGAKIELPEKEMADLTFWTVLLDATEKTQAPFLARALANDFGKFEGATPKEAIEKIREITCSVVDSSDLSKDGNIAINFLYTAKAIIGAENISGIDDAIATLKKCLVLNTTTNRYHWNCPKNTTDRLKYDTEHITRHIQAALKNLESSSDWKIDGIKIIALRIIFQYYAEIIQGYSNREHLGPLLKRLESRLPEIMKVFAVSPNGKNNLDSHPLTIVSLRDVSLDMRKVVPLLLCKHLYNAQKEQVGRDPRRKHLNLIIDEAHNILSFDSSRETEAWRDYRLETFEEIIKEGRKFGVFLTIASQRPQDISQTITSQLHNYIVHRLVNQQDIEAVENAISFLDRASFETIPILPTGVAILAGLCTQVPVRVKIDPIDPGFEPNSRTPSITAYWGDPIKDEQGTGKSK